MTRRRTRSRPAGVLVLTAALGLVGCGSSSTPAGSTATTVDGVQRLDVEAFATLASTPSVVVLDVRTPEEFATGHLANAVNVDFNAPDFAAKVQVLDRTKTYAVYCRSGNRSGHALDVMKQAGFGKIADLESGIVGWTQAGKPVVTT